MNCPYCQTDNRQQAVFCKECGRLLGTSCPNCGADLPDAAKYCDMCGHDLSQRVSRREAPAETASQPAAPTVASQPSGTHLQQYIPRELMSKLATAQRAGGMVGERRIVTMLFCDVKDSTSAAEQLDPEEWSEIINGAFKHMIGPVYRYEGMVARLMGDGILAFFGAPIAHEDDAVRAILAGLEIISGSEGYQRQIRERHGIDIGLRVGINTGRVVVGAVGSDLRLEYTALGDAINVAARMEQTAVPGTVQIAEDTYRLVAPLFDFEELGGVSVKGKSKPVIAYRVLRRRAGPSQHRGIAGMQSPLVGRDEEVASLNGAVKDLQTGQGRVVFLIGQAGLGKTRLVRELFSQWSDSGPENEAIQFWVHQPVASYQASEAYRVLKDQIRLMYGIADGATPDEIAVKLEENIAKLPLADQSAVYESLARVLGVLEEEEPGMTLQGEIFKRQLFDAALASIAPLAGRKPAVLVLDDLHWADPASVEAIGYLLQLVDSTPILYLCIARPDRSAASWGLKKQAEKEYPEQYQETVLGPLSEEDSQCMLDGLLAGVTWPPRLRAMILDKAEGNPFFIEEVVQTLIDSGVVQQNGNGQWHVAAELEEITVPDSLQALLASRIDRLPERDRQVLQSASVIGRSFDVKVLRQINDGEVDLERSLDTLIQADLIEEEAGSAGTTYRFRNTLVQETVYHSILRRTRREYHRRVGEALMMLAFDQWEEQLPALAYHFYQAQDEKALAINQRAGDEAADLYANQEAVTYYRRSLEMSRRFPDMNSERLTQLYLRFGRVLELNSTFDEALDNYEEMAVVARERRDRMMELAALVASGTIYSTANERFDASRAEALAEKALALAEEVGDEATEAKIQWNLLNMYRLSERSALALAAGERSLELARKNELREQLAYTANDMAHVYLSVGQQDKARQIGEEAIGLWRELGNQPMLADSLATAALQTSSLGDYEKTIALSEEAYQISLSIKNIWGQSYSRLAICQLYWQRGEPDKAIEAMKECMRLGEQAGFLVAQLYIGSYLALSYACLGDFERALSLARQAHEWTRANIPRFESVVLSNLGQVLLLAGDMQEATAVFGELMASRTHMEPFYEAVIEEAKCRFLLSQNEYDRAARSAGNMIEFLRMLDGRLLMPTAQHLLSLALMGNDQLEQAGEALTLALSEAEEMMLLWPRWQILASLAELQIASGQRDQAEQSRYRARQDFELIASRAPTADLRESFEIHPHWAGLLYGLGSEKL